MDMTEIMDNLGYLESELTDKKGFFSKKVDVEKCAGLIEKLKVLIPQNLKEADFIVSKVNEILANADDAAEKTIDEAKKRATIIISESEIVSGAELERKRIVEHAYMQCDALVAQTKAHLDGMFKETEQFLYSTLAMIRNNREELNGALLMNNRED